MSKALQVGDNCPAFSLPNHQGNIIDIQQFIGKKYWFYFFTPKTTRQVAPKKHVPLEMPMPIL